MDHPRLRGHGGPCLSRVGKMMQEYDRFRVTIFATFAPVSVVCHSNSRTLIYKKVDSLRVLLEHVIGEGKRKYAIGKSQSHEVILAITLWA